MALPHAADDRRCFAAALSNPVRRWLAPPRTEVDAAHVAEGLVVADLGAGVGYHAPEILRRLGPRGVLYLVDIDADNLELSREQVRDDPRVRRLVSSAAALTEIDAASVDRVLMSLLLCCLVDKERAMDEAWRILRPDGELLVTYPWAGLCPFRRRRSLRVTSERWSTLVARHPWEVRDVRPGRLVRRHLLAKPGLPRTSPPE